MSGNKYKGSLTGYEVMQRADGSVHQSGLPSTAAVSQHDLLDVAGFMTPAVVLATYYADEDDRPGSEKRNVVCDVRTIGPYSRPLPKVPVLQLRQSLWDEDLVVPRAPRQNIEGGQLSTGAPGTATTVEPTRAESMDGDHVVVGFMHNNPRFPVILPFTLGHPKANSAPVKADGRVRRIRHGGTRMEWSEDGDWLLDASEAAKEELGTKGSEQANNGTSGVVTLKTKDGGGDTLRLVLDADGSVLLEGGGGTEALELDKAAGESTLSATTKAVLDAPLIELSGAPLEPVIKGTSYIAAETALYGVLTAYMAATQPVWEALAQVGAPGPLKVAEAAGKAAAAWSAAAGYPAWVISSGLAKSVKVKTG